MKLDLFIRKVFAFVKRGFITWISYKVRLGIDIATWVARVLLAFFLAKILGNDLLAQRYGGDFFSFLLLGLALERYMGISVKNFMLAIQSEQREGTLEMALMTPTSLSTFLIGQGVWGYVRTTIQLVFCLTVSILFLGARIETSITQILSATFILLISVVSMAGFGLMAAGIIIFTKRGDPISFTFYQLNYLFAGVLFPIEILPLPLQVIGRFFPLTYCLEGIRLILLRGYALTNPVVLRDITALLFLSLFTVPLGLFLFRYGFRRARREGSLAFF